jgi:hypothetical protein
MKLHVFQTLTGDEALKKALNNFLESGNSLAEDREGSNLLLRNKREFGSFSLSLAVCEIIL